MYARKTVLEQNNIRIPTIDKPWTGEEFNAALAKLKATGQWTAPLDLATANTGEWWPYAYSPFLQSFGGDLINRDGYTTADGALNGPEALAWATWFRGLVDRGLHGRQVRCRRRRRLPQRQECHRLERFLGRRSSPREAR